MTKIKKYEDVKNLTDVAEVFYFHEAVPCVPAFRVIADYARNAVFLKTEPGFYEYRLLVDRPELFIPEFFSKAGHDGIEDITFSVLDAEVLKNLRKAQGALEQLEASIYACFRNGQANYQKK